MLYDRGIFPSVRLKARVISVGNLTVGGTGKTPLVERLAQLLRDGGYKVAVSSRGYRRKGKSAVVVSDEQSVKIGAEEAGDEPFLLARRLPGVPVVVGKDRAKAGKLAVESWGCNVLLLDDSFQHLRIKRDFDIVVVDTTKLWGNGKLLPAGPLREPLSELKRADAVVFSRVDEGVSVDEKIERIRRFTTAPVFLANHKPMEWVLISNGRTYPLGFLKQKFVLAFAGIGNPKSFQNTLMSLGVHVVDFVSFRDHYWYKLRDLNRMTQLAIRRGAVALVTTEKDGIRLPTPLECEIPLYSLKIDFEIVDGIEELKRILDPVLTS